MEKKRIGIMGGTFNPIHLGHLMMGECAYEQYNLEQIWFMPSKVPPHKRKIELASEEERMKMVEMSIKGNPHFSISTVELERSGITYSVDTLSILREKNENVEFFFILGVDSLFELASWKEPGRFLSMASILVASRYGMDVEKIVGQIEKLKREFGGKFHIITIPTIGISSSQIRMQIRKNKSVRYYVTDEVFQFIQEHNLYRKEEGHEWTTYCRTEKKAEGESAGKKV